MYRLTLLAALALVSVAAGASEASETFYAALAPPPESESNGSGSATLVLSTDHSEVSYNITYTGLSSPETGAHIHRADGSIAHSLPLGTTKVGTWFDPTPIDVAGLQYGQLYIVIHSELYGGELYGDITDEKVPTETTTWGKVKALYH
jgi:hypothetical protein